METTFHEGAVPVAAVPAQAAPAPINDRLAALRARVAALAAEAAKSALTEQEQEEARLIEETKKHVEAAAAAAATRRGLDLEARTERARSRLPAGTHLAGVDLVALFPADSPPPPERLPNGGVIVLRNPPDAADKAAAKEIEAKVKAMSTISAELVVASTVDPDVQGPDGGGAEGMKLRAFLDAYGPATLVLGGKVRELGGARVLADKRGGS
jgi:hypothetical protein